MRFIEEHSHLNAAIRAEHFDRLGENIFDEGLIDKTKLHVAVETTAGLISLLTASLLVGRFTRTLQARDLLLAGSLAVLAVANLVLVLALGFGLLSMKDTLARRIAKVESMNEQTQSENEKILEIRSSETDKKMNDLVADLDLIKRKVGMTSLELNHARNIAQTLKRQQEQSSKELASQLAAKANSSEVDVARQEAATRISEVQQDSESKLGDVSGEVTGIKRDLLATRDDFGRLRRRGHELFEAR